MNDLSTPKIAAVDDQPRVKNKVRFVTAASLFDGHDASINIMRRILQSNGVEVVHLGHNRSVDEVVTAALAGRRARHRHLQLPGRPRRILQIHDRPAAPARRRAHQGVRRRRRRDRAARNRRTACVRRDKIFSPEDGQRMGLVGMIQWMVQQCDIDLSLRANLARAAARRRHRRRHRPLAQLITALENDKAAAALRAELLAAAQDLPVPTLGITGTGGAGKSSLTDELIRRIRLDQGDALNIAVISIDPSRRKSGGALLGDRIRMNAINPWAGQARVFMRSLATREAGSEISQALPDVIAACKVAGFDLVIVETSGIGQGDAAIVPHVDVSMYVMTPEFGAASQLEKSTCSISPTSSPSTSSTAKARRMRCATSPSSTSATANCGASVRKTCRCTAPRHRASTTTA
jgi:methylmalonyl-CoA mutase